MFSNHFPLTSAVVKWVWKIKRAVFIFLLFPMAGVLGIHCYNWKRVREAEKMVYSLAALRTREDERKLDQEFPGLNLSFNAPIKHVWWGKTLIAIGAPPWLLHAELKRLPFGYEKYVLIAQAERPERFMSVGEVPMSDAELRDAECTSADWRHHRGLTIRREYAHFDGLALRVDQGAPEELKARAWQASIDCLKKWGGCKTAFDMHHEGARIYEQDRARIRADWPQIVLSNPACKPYWKQFQEK